MRSLIFILIFFMGSMAFSVDKYTVRYLCQNIEEDVMLDRYIIMDHLFYNEISGHDFLYGETVTDEYNFSLRVYEVRIAKAGKTPKEISDELVGLDPADSYLGTGQRNANETVFSHNGATTVKFNYDKNRLKSAYYTLGKGMHRYHCEPTIEVPVRDDGAGTREAGGATDDGEGEVPFIEV